jgi:DNA-binding transcriptional LysR family regulator
MKFELSQLRAFVAVADAASFRAAAEFLGVAQSSISQQIGRLEQELGYKLFERTTRSVRMTPRGDCFLTSAIGILELVEDAGRRFRNGALEGVLRLGIVEDVPHLVLRPILAAFRSEHGRFGLSLTTGPNARLLDQLDRGELDVVVVERLPGRSQGSLLHIEPLVWCGQTSAIPADGSSVVPLVVRPEPSAARRLMTSSLQRSDRPFAIVAECDAATGIHAAVASGFGLTAYGAGHVPTDIPELPRDCGLPTMEAIEYAFDQRAQPHSPTLQAFLALLNARSLKLQTDRERAVLKHMP